jgi:hydroxymethylpyrimidine pyrophosphatase-like HAD family hydrolase
MQHLEADLDRQFPGLLSLHTIRSPRYSDWLCEIAPAGVTKWTGVASLAAAWGIRGDEICAVGDDVNDLPMVRAAGLGIAMGNGRPELHAAADRIVGSHEAEGMRDVAELVLASLA